MSSSADWVSRDIASIWHGFTQMRTYASNEPLIVERAEGVYLFDVQGRRYLDAISSLWVNTLGHNVAELNEALLNQAAQIAHATMLGNSSRTVIEFAEALQAVVPVDRARFVWAADGAAAVEQALKIAFQFWTNQGVRGRSSYLAFGGAYHGDTIGSLSVGAGGFGTEIFDPLRFNVERARNLAEPGAIGEACTLIEQHAERLAAVVVEPLVQGAAGMMIHSPADLHQLAATCRRHDVLLISDEVATGFGRTGTLFASEQAGITPDLMVLGKGIAAGYLPMSATAVSERVWSEFLGPDLSERTLYHGHSFGGNALAAAVGKRHLELLSEWSVLDNVRVQAEYLRGVLSRCEAHPLVREVRCLGLMGAIVVDCGHDELLARRWCTEMVRSGVLTRSLGEVITVVPPLVISESHLDEFEAAFWTAAAAVGS